MEVKLGCIRETDAESVIRILRNDVVKKTYMLPDFPDDASAYKLFLRLMELSGDENRFVRGIFLQDKLIGFLNDVAISGDSLELGWALHPDWHHQGYGTQAVSLAIDTLFALGYRRINAGAFQDNSASVHVMEKCGMHSIPFTEVIHYRGEDHKCVYYSIEKA